MNTRHRTLSRDTKGYFRPYIGWRVGEDGKRSQPRFNLGKDEREAQYRYAAIQKLYEEATHPHARDSWTDEALGLAQQIAKGHRDVKYGPPTHKQAPHIFSAPDEGLMWYGRLIEFLRREHPSITILPENADLMSKSIEMNKEFVSNQIERLRAQLDDLGALSLIQQSVPDLLIKGTWYEALEAYKGQIERDGDRLASGKLKAHPTGRIERVKRLKEHHGDFPLYDLTFDKCNEIVSYWRNRPLTKRGARCSKDNARHHINELMSFFKWLDTTATFGWPMPKGALTIKRKVTRLDEDLKKSVYSVQELAKISRHATDWERLALLVGLNCAMGAAELGRLTKQMILINHMHEYCERLKFSSTDKDSFVRMYRPKTDVFSEHLLWPETVAILRWALDRACPSGERAEFFGGGRAEVPGVAGAQVAAGRSASVCW